MKNKSVLLVVPFALVHLLEIWTKHSSVAIVESGGQVTGGRFKYIIALTPVTSKWKEEALRPRLEEEGVIVE